MFASAPKWLHLRVVLSCVFFWVGVEGGMHILRHGEECTDIYIPTNFNVKKITTVFNSSTPTGL